MPQHVIDREKVFRSLPGDRRAIMKRTGLRSYEVPGILRWLQRRCLAGNSNTRGIWEPVAIPGRGKNLLGTRTSSPWNLSWLQEQEDDLLVIRKGYQEYHMKGGGHRCPLLQRNWTFP